MVVIALGVVLIAAACVIIGVAFVQGSWWYSYGTDRALSSESRARVEAIWNQVNASGAAPEALPWLNRVLDPDADPTAVRTYLMTAWEAVKAADDPELAEAAKELWEIAQTIQRSGPGTGPSDLTTTVPRPLPTLEWPW